MKDFTDAIGSNGFPYCPICGAALGWSGDFQASELGYLPEDADLEEDAVVHVLCCQECNHDFEATIDETGRYRLLSSVSMREDSTEDEEPDFEYTEYARTRFPDAGL